MYVKYLLYIHVYIYIHMYIRIGNFSGVVGIYMQLYIDYTNIDDGCWLLHVFIFS